MVVRIGTQQSCSRKLLLIAGGTKIYCFIVVGAAQSMLKGFSLCPLVAYGRVE